MRRQLDLSVEDFIAADVCVADAWVCDLIQVTWHDGIADEVRAKSLAIHGGGPAPAGILWQLSKNWHVEGIQMTIGISRAPD